MSLDTADETAAIAGILSGWPKLHSRVSLETMASERRDVLYLLAALPPRFEPAFGAFTEANIHLEDLENHIEDLALMSQSLHDDQDHEPLQPLLAEGTPEGVYDYPAQYLNSISFAPMGTLNPKQVLDSVLPLMKDSIWRLSGIFLQVGKPTPSMEMVEKIGAFLQRHMELLGGLAWLSRKLSTDSPDCRELQLQLSCYSMYIDHIVNPAVPTDAERKRCMDWWYVILRSIEEYNEGVMTGVFGVPGGFVNDEEGGILYPGEEQVYDDDTLYDGDDEEEMAVSDDEV